MEQRKRVAEFRRTLSLSECTFGLILDDCDGRKALFVGVGGEEWLGCVIGTPALFLSHNKHGMLHAWDGWAKILRR